MADETLITGNSEDSGSGKGQSEQNETETETNSESNSENEGQTWRDTLPEDLKNEASLSNFTSLEALAKSYVNAQRLLGAEKISIPTKHSTDEDWNEVFKKLGLPDQDKYEIDGIDKEKATEFDKEFKELMFKNNILPKQAKNIYKAIKDAETAKMQKEDKEFKDLVDKNLNDLKDRWGNAYEEKLYNARNAFKTFGNEKAKEYLEQTGIGNDPILLEIFSTVGEKLLDDKFKGEFKSGNSTPEEAQRKIDKIMDDPEHPYHLAAHPGHDGAVKEVEKLFEDLTRT